MRRQSLVVASNNERQVLELVRRHNGASRAQLARWTSITNQSISRITADLIARGLCEFGEAMPAASKGPAALSVHLAPSAVYTIGVIVDDRCGFDRLDELRG